MKSLPGSHFRRSVVATLFVVCVAGTTAHAAAGTTATPQRAGELTIVDINGNYGPLTHGGSATDFSIRPPITAACPGDSEHDQWRVQSYLVPEGTDVGAIHWQLQGPGITNGFPLYDWYTHPVSQVLLRPNYGPAQPGLMDEFPPMNFAVFSPGNVPAGTYRLGIACTYFRKTDKYWDTVVVITAAANDKPAGFVWRTAGAPAVSPSGGGTVGWLPIVGGVLAVIAVGLFLVRRRKKSFDAGATTDSSPVASAIVEPDPASTADPFSYSYSNSYSTTPTTTHSSEDSP